MAGFNRVTLVGRLTRDPELRHTQSGHPVTTLRLAVDRGGRDEGADFITVVCWNKTAETVAKYLSKGRLTLVDGRLQVRQYDAQDGTRRTVYEVVAHQVVFLSGGGGRDGNAGNRAPSGEGRAASAEPDAYEDDGSPFGDHDDMPF